MFLQPVNQRCTVGLIELWRRTNAGKPIEHLQSTELSGLINSQWSQARGQLQVTLWLAALTHAIHRRGTQAVFLRPTVEFVLFVRLFLRPSVRPSICLSVDILVMLSLDLAFIGEQLYLLRNECAPATDCCVLAVLYPMRTNTWLLYASCFMSNGTSTSLLYASCSMPNAHQYLVAVC